MILKKKHSDFFYFFTIGGCEREEKYSPGPVAFTDGIESLPQPKDKM